jgi:hypothetical protein
VATVESWALRAARLPAALVEATPDAVRSSAEVLERRARVNLLAVTGGDLRLSGAVSLRGRRAGTGGAGRKVDVQVRLVGAGRRAEAHVTPVGPVSLVEAPTRRHRIPRQIQRVSRRSVERRGVFIPGVGFRAHVNHPGTRGRRPVSRAMQTHSDEAGREGLAVFAAAVERHMRGA